MIRDLAKSLLKARASKRGVVLRDNWGAVLAGDVEGDVVVANREHYAFALHVPGVRDPVPENVGSPLNWRSRIPDRLYGRDSEFSDLLDWCCGPADIRVRILWGDGGARWLRPGCGPLSRALIPPKRRLELDSAELPARAQTAPSRVGRSSIETPLSTLWPTLLHKTLKWKYLDPTRRIISEADGVVH
jgi:hypothetical protein